MKLVIAEKPSAAQSYAKALNITAKKSGYFEVNGYIITWCIGHLAGLADIPAGPPPIIVFYQHLTMRQVRQHA